MDAFIGEIRLFPYFFAPENWLDCDGRQLGIQTYTALYSVIGSAFGGDGRTYFCLPKIQNVTPVQAGTVQNTSFKYAATVGFSAVTLAMSTMAPHSHGVNASASANAFTPANAIWGEQPARRGQLLYAKPSGTLQRMYSPMLTTVGGTGGGGVAPHNNMQPYLVMRFCICCYEGVYPVRP